MESVPQLGSQVVSLLLSSVTRKARGHDEPRTAVLGHRVAVCIGIGWLLPAFVRSARRTRVGCVVRWARIARRCAAAGGHKLFPDLAAHWRCDEKGRCQHDPDKLSAPGSHNCAPLEPYRTSAEPRRTDILRCRSARGIFCQMRENCSKRPVKRPYEFAPQWVQRSDRLAKIG